MRVLSRSPGRICLFGEHQDYMDLAVISAAIDLRIVVAGSIGSGKEISVDLPDIGQRVNFNSDSIVYEGEKDYIRSAVKVLRERGLIGDIQVEAELRGDIPMKAGTSSSSALSVSWIGFLLASRYSSEELDGLRPEIAELAYVTEVEEFNESGGMQDQLASALGGVNYFTFYDRVKTEPLSAPPGSFVLGDSGEPKDTQKTLKRVRQGQEAGLKELQEISPFSSNYEIEYLQASEYFSRVGRDVRPFLEAVLENYEITKKACGELKQEPVDTAAVAGLMNRHHGILRDKLGISTKKIEKMIDEALKAGARSAKINGSGEGGCMFAYCTDRTEEVAEAIRKAGGTPYVIRIGNGLDVEVAG